MGHNGPKFGSGGRRISRPKRPTTQSPHSKAANGKRARQDSNLSEPGGRAVSQVRSWRSGTRPTGFEPQRAWRASGVTGSILEKLDAPDRIRTSASLEGERCHRFDPGEAGRARQDSNL